MARGRSKGRRRGGAAPPSSASQELEDDQVDFDPDKLSITVDGHSKSFSEWTLDYACHYYPDVGQRTYRVPPVDFNTQELTDDRQLGFSQLKDPKEENRKKDRSQADVGRRLEELGRLLEESSGRGLFIVSSAYYDNYLSDLKSLRTRGGKLPPLPKEVTQRGELDFLALHPVQGIVLLQVKGVGFPDSWNPTEAELQEAIRKKVEEAQNQLTRDMKVLQHVMADLKLTCDLHTVVALPFVSESLLHTSFSDTGMGGEEGEIVYLCADQVGSTEAMLSWWNQRIVREGSNPLEDIQLKAIVGRYCGLLSTVSVWCKTSLRVEVRDVAEAVPEVGDRFAHLVLTANQRKALDSPDPLLYLHGPPGTGKSVLMVIKARQWLLQGHDVLVLNVDFGRQGNPVGHYIHDSIKQWLLKTSGDQSTGPDPGRASAGRSGPSSTAALGGKRSKGRKKRGKDSGGSSDHGAPSCPEDSPADKERGSPVSVSPTPEHSTSKRKASDADVGSGEADTSSATWSSCSASLSSSSEAESTRRRVLGQAFRLDFDLGLNVKDGQAQQLVQDLMELVQQTVRPGVPCHFLIDEFYWKDRLLPVVEYIRRRFPRSAVWCAEVSGDTIPPDFKSVMLKNVLRCPPSVQAVLKKVDWTPDHQDLYSEDSTLQGLPTDGFKPTLLEHRNHPALSPLDCVHCADNLLRFFREELKLDFGPVCKAGPASLALSPEIDDLPPHASPPPPPPCCTSTRPAEDPSSSSQHPAEPSPKKKSLPVPKTKKKKRSHCLPRRVKWSDIVVLFSYPQRCLSRPRNLLLIDDKPQDIHHHNIDNSVFLGRMKEAGLPLVFRAPNSDAREIALPTEDQVLFSVTNAVTGLERKVVVYIPCESTSYQYPVTRRRGGHAPPSTTPTQSSAAVLAGQTAPSGSRGLGPEQCVHQKTDQQHPGPGDKALVSPESHRDSQHQPSVTSLVSPESHRDSQHQPSVTSLVPDSHSDSQHQPSVTSLVSPDSHSDSQHQPSVTSPDCDSGEPNPGPSGGESTELNTATRSVVLPDTATDKSDPRCPHHPHSAKNLNIPDCGERANHDDDPASLDHDKSENREDRHDGCKPRLPSAHTLSTEEKENTHTVSKAAVNSVTAGLSQEDWATIHERLLEQNQKGLFYAASRCLSVFVLIIP